MLLMAPYLTPNIIRHAIAAITGAPWAQTVAPAVLLCGLVAIWRGLLGGRDRARGLLMRHIGMRERIEGFRLLVFGLVLLGVAGAVLWQQEWLLILALGIGFVEILESSERRMNAQREALKLSESRYRGGVSAYLEVLDAQRELFDAELSHASALRDRAVAVVRLFRALGGGWEASE